MPNQIIIRIPFTIEEDGKKFSDSLNFTQDEYDALSADEIEAMKRARFQAWLDFLANPPPVEDPSLEDLGAEKKELLKKIEDVDRKSVELYGDLPPIPENIEPEGA